MVFELWTHIIKFFKSWHISSLYIMASQRRVREALKHAVVVQGADSGGAAMLHDPIRTAGRLRERDDCIQACRSASVQLCLNPAARSLITLLHSSPTQCCIGLQCPSHSGGFKTVGSRRAGC